MSVVSVLSPKERLERTLGERGADRPPVICPGGMMNAAIVEVMTSSGKRLPEAHHSGSLMGDLAAEVAEQTGFENFGLPFCMTVEAEALGSAVDYGTLECEPKIAREVFPSVTQVSFKTADAILKSARGGVVLDAVNTLAKKAPDVPVIGTLTGPVSLAASIVDPMTFLKELRKEKEAAHRVIDYVTEALAAYALEMAAQGAAAITIADPTATGEILGPRFFDEYAVPALNRIIDAVQEAGVPVITHICGNVHTIKGGLVKLHGKAVSVDAMVSLEKLKHEDGIKTTMGNLSTYLLEFGGAEKVRQNTERLRKSGVDILAPACGLSTSTPLANIRAFTDAAREGA